jgi:hypothetical protein
MTELLAKGNTFEWTPRRETSFQELKKRLSMALVLTMPDMEKPFLIYYDASSQGFGCVLMQDGHAICFEAIKKTRREVPDPRLGISSHGTCFKNMDALHHW